ncbi:G-protein coupled receptor Mth2 isoform X6 [Aethina tumida]|uniref:G-protein coupled receptor Mth2 isoform X6 n=1 Tax=Aethina tumida TaxID=116153 RepID=UPI002148DEAB|nr:G-protein coupled receptor Mth2 isoform X6 [Aethina tumida]
MYEIWRCCEKGQYASEEGCVQGDFTATLFRDQNLLFNYEAPPECDSGVNQTSVIVNSDIIKWHNYGIFDVGDTFYNINQTCFESYYNTENLDDDVLMSICIPTEGMQDSEEGRMYLGMLISIPFLFLTLLVHCILPEKNLHMKALMCYVTNLMLSYIMLVTIELSEGFSTGVCTFLGFTCLFCFISSIFWINVICIDIWLTFSGKLGVHGSRNEGRRVLFYSAYAVLAPVILILITFLINQYGDSTKDYHPGIGGGQCFLKTKWPYLYYFHLPMGILLTVNITLFTLTAIKIRQAKRETKVLKRDDNRTTSENSKNIFRFNLYLKLLFAMGVNWSLETISWALETFATVPKEIFYVTDFCNAIYGLLIFLIFVCKKRTWKILKKRYYQFLGRSHLAHSMSTTNQSTRITSVSISDAPTNGEMRNAESIRLSKRAN